MARFAVIGAGITGLSAAWELERGGHDVVVFEAADVVGGKLQDRPVPGLDFRLDAAADAFLARVPDALELCAEIGIDDLVHPASAQAWVHTADGMHPLPKGQLLGIPTDLDELAASGLISDEGMARVRKDLHADWEPPTGDRSVGALVRERLGDEVCEHLVEPLLGGINGGEADGLSTAATAPQIWACAARGGSLIRAAAEVRAAATATGAPVFAAPADGMASLPRRLAEHLRAEIRLATPAPVVALDGGEVHLDGERFDGVIVATPADVAARLLSAVPDAAAALGGIEFASVALVAVVADADAVDHPLDGSGFVTARTANTSITACSWGSSKWAHWDDGRHVVLRASLGHDTDPVDWCAENDDVLTATVLEDLTTTMGVLIEPVGVRVTRWPRSFPQYRPGHLDVVRTVDDALASAGPVRAAGMSLGGIGVPACIRQGRAAARSLLS